jgi:nucleoside-diphosphate-sugar epimerase
VAQNQTRNGKETDFYTDECRTVVSIHDVVDILVYICKHGVASSGIYNMGGRDRVSRWRMLSLTNIGYDTRYLVAKTKALLPVTGVASPLDISMDSSKLSQLQPEFSSKD